MIATITEDTEDVEKFVFAVVRGDMDVNETKLANAVKAKDLRPAHDEEIQAIGAEAGYGSPIGVKGALIVVDDAIPASPNLVAGANEDGFHFLNVNFGRDYQADIVADIAAAKDGDFCPRCGKAMRTSRGVEIGNIFKLGTKYTSALGATFLDKDGKEKPVIMGSYGIGVGRLLACVAEEHNDEHGLIFPITIAPYQVHLVNLSRKSNAAEELYQTLQNSGIEVLFDDRDGSPGVKFNDADLLGLPLRVTVGDRSLKKGGVEVKRRAGGDAKLVPLDNIVLMLKDEITALTAEIMETVVEVPFKE